MHTPDYATPFLLHRIYLDQGGYDQSGSYWGHGQPLYRYQYVAKMPMGSIETGTVRGATREAAKAQIRKWYPNAKFRK